MFIMNELLEISGVDLMVVIKEYRGTVISKCFYIKEIFIKSI